jgi:hypothetical protein
MSEAKIAEVTKHRISLFCVVNHQGMLIRYLSEEDAKVAILKGPNVGPVIRIDGVIIP